MTPLEIKVLQEVLLKVKSINANGHKTWKAAGEVLAVNGVTNNIVNEAFKTYFESKQELIDAPLMDVQKWIEALLTTKN